MALGDIRLSSNFELSSQRPLDARLQVADITERDAIPFVKRYPMMEVSVLSELKSYKLNYATVDVGINNNANWVPIGGGHIIQGEGVDFIKRDKLNFKGSLVSVTDNSIDDSSDITIDLPTVKKINYGYLYNEYAVNNANFAPIGWHVPTKAEYDALLTYLGSESVSGNELKEAGLDHWNATNTGNNASNFTAYGGGMRANTGIFYLLKDHGYFWTNSVVTGTTSYYKRLVNNSDAVLDGISDNKYGFSVRLIKDDSISPGTLSDYDGNVYDTINIDGQIWTVQNWACTKLNDGTPIDNVTNNANWAASTDAAYSAYNNDELNAFSLVPINNETDPVFNAWLLNTPPAYPGDIPTALSELSEDTTHRVVTDAEILAWNNKLASEVDPIFLQTIVNTNGITGFVDGDNINVAYNYTNRTITLTGDLRYYFRGTLHELTSPWTSTPHTATVGRWFLFCTDGTNFTWANSVWEFKDVMVAVVKYGATAVESFGIREPHKTMDSEVHKELHAQIGTYKSSGGILTAGTFIENTATDAANSPGFDSAVLEDEDLRSVVNSWLEGTYTTAYVGPGSALVFDVTKTRPFHDAGANTYIQINDPIAGTIVAGAASNFYNVYQVLVPACADADSQKYRMIMLQPQVAYNSLVSAQGEDIRSLNLGNFASLFSEFVIHARITYRTRSGDSNAGRCRIETGGITYITGSKANQVSVAGFSTNNHAALSNRQWDQSAHTSGLAVPKLAAFDASGLPVYSDVPIPYFDATIGSGGDYADIAAAQTAGKYRLKAIGNITMSADITISNSIYIDLNGYTLDFGSYNVTFTGSNTGVLTIINSTPNISCITFSYGVAKHLFHGSSSIYTDRLIINNIRVVNNSTVNNACISNMGYWYNCTLYASNYNAGCFGRAGAYLTFHGKLYNCKIYGGGTSCMNVILDGDNTGENCYVENLTLLGTFSSGDVIVHLKGIFKNITYSSSSTCTAIMSFIDQFIDITGKVTIDLYGGAYNLGYLTNSYLGGFKMRSYSKVDNVKVVNAVTLLQNAANTNIVCKNCYFSSTLNITESTGRDNIIENNTVVGATTINGDYIKFNKNICTGLVTLASGSEYCDISHNTLTGGLTNSSGNTTNLVRDNI